MPSEGPSQSSERPTIRVLHHMARSGGTVICRCLASMDGIVLLSEIHPLGRRMFDPLVQAHEWYGLLDAGDLRAARSGRFGFRAAMALVNRRCAERGLTLVLRDWSHLDFTGIPFVRPAFRSRLAQALATEFAVCRFATVRHPLDQWLSLARDPVYREQLGPEQFLEGAARFATMAVDTGFVRYEDFTRDADAALQALCAALQLPFDPGYRDRWPDYRNITGDVLPGRAPPRAIRSLERQAQAAGERERMRADPRYADIIECLGYSD